tara:strand:- start:107 stop:457 length:351 start_codon:yes stop_codon:yes gene_type:complete
MKYEALPEYDNEEITRIMSNGTIEEKTLLPLSLGIYCTNWKFAQDICLTLSKNENEEISSNAILGLAYLARTQKKLQKELVMPILLEGLKKHSKYLGKIEDAISDIEIFLKWKFPS